MNGKQFAELKDAVHMMARHLRGGKIAGIRMREVPQPDGKAIREAANVSQCDFARLIGINLRTLRNWEQRRSRPTGPARALLKIVASIRNLPSGRCMRDGEVRQDLGIRWMSATPFADVSLNHRIGSH
jgi:putative transcriptional regulator